MGKPPKIDLSQLREIGWSEWDPIALQEIDPDWRLDGGEDEYDTYLLRTAVLLWNRRPEEEAVGYLVGVETDDMGMGLSATTRTRAVATVRSVAAYLETLRTGD